MSYRLGIDVGGTNTDAAVIDEHFRVIAKAKHPTTEDVTTGIYRVIEKVIKTGKVDPGHIEYAMLGTTHCTNAIVERKYLNKVMVVRIGKPATSAVKPLTGWPEDLKAAIGDHQYIVHGGHEFDGRRIAEINVEEIRGIAKDVKGRVNSVAITSVFSPVNNEHEQEALEILREELGDISYSLSHEIGSIGLIERENATVLNASVVDVAGKANKAFDDALSRIGIKAKKYFGQNDGTLMAIDYAMKYPVLTIACGPTNSIRGACFLTDQKEGLVVDVGGTTTDIGILNKGFPRQSTIAVEIGGVRTNFRMPDLLSIGLGGGTVIKTRNAGDFTIGPESVGSKITEKALIFGGSILTATDVAVKMGLADLGDKETTDLLNEDLASRAHKKMMTTLEEAIDKMKTEAADMPVILVGGGNILFSDKLNGASVVYKPKDCEVANAIGAAISQVSGEVEKVFNLSEISRDEALMQAKEKAVSEAIKAGADENTIEIVDVEDVPLAYLPGNATRVKVKAAGNLLTAGSTR